MVVEAEDNIDHGDVDPSSIVIIVEIEDINDEAPDITNLPKTVQWSEVRKKAINNNNKTLALVSILTVCFVGY